MRGFVSCVLLALAACSGSPTAVERPNLILVVGDDHGYPDFGFMGSPYVRTPNLDRLAAEGTVFRNGYVTASSCGPSLRSLLTGLHPIQTYYEGLRQRKQRAEGGAPRGPSITLPRVLAEAGYVSFQGGKFSERDYQVAGFSDGMQRPGDDPAFGGLGRVLGRDSLEPLFDFIDAHESVPFFLWVAPMLPHWPYDAGPTYREPYEGLGLSPEALGYYANVTRFDEVLGRLIAYLDEKQLLERSLIVYLADNGWDQAPQASHPQPLDGPRGKLTLHDLGLRTPIILRWPGHIPAGRERNEFVSSLDLFPTLLDYAGAAPARVDALAALQGRSLRSLLEGEPGDEGGASAWSIGWLPWVRANQYRPDTRPPRKLAELEQAYVLRTPRWRYYWYKEWDADALYDIGADPSEERDVKSQHGELVEGFRRRILVWRRKMVKAAAPSPLAPAN